MAKLSPEQQAARRAGLGGSDVAAAIGISRWKTPVELWQEKTGQVEPEDISDREFVQWGQLLEDVIADEWARRHGHKVRRSNITRVDAELDFLRANIDRDVVGLREGLEVKNTSAWMADEWGADGSDEVPLFYLTQGVHYMRVLDYDAWNFAVLMGGNELRSYRITRDRDTEESLLELLARFWQCVETMTPPPATTVEDLVRLNPNATGTLQATEEIAGRVAEGVQLKTQIKTAEQRLEEIKLEVGAFLGDKSDLVDPLDDSITILTYRQRKGGTYLDQKSLEADGVDLDPYRRRRAGTRTFLFK